MIKDVLGTYHEPRMFRSLFCGGTFSASKWKKTKSLCVPQKEWTTFPVKAMKKKTTHWRRTQTIDNYPTDDDYGQGNQWAIHLNVTPDSSTTVKSEKVQRPFLI